MADPEVDGIEIIEVRPVYENRFCVVYDDRVRMPSGTEGTYVRAQWKSPWSVAVLPVLPDGRVCLLRVFRHAPRRWLLEVPKGFGDPGRSVLEDAARELSEELGLRAGALVELGAVFADPGMIGNPICVVVAWDCTPGGPARPEAMESLQAVSPMGPDALRVALEAGEICDSVSAMLLWRYLTGSLPPPTRHKTP